MTTLRFPRITSGTVAIDTETYDPFLFETGPGWAFQNKKYGEIVGFSVAWGEEGRTDGEYYPLRHRLGGNYNDAQCLAWLKDICENTNVTKVFFNRLYDEGWLLCEGIKVKGKVFDVHTAIPLLDEYRKSYSLDNCLKDYLGSSKDTDGLYEFCKRMKWGTSKKVVGSNLYRMPGSIVAPYGKQDAVGTLDLWYKVQPMLVEEGLVRIYKLETDLAPVLLGMRLRGIRVDTDAAEIAAKEYKKKEKELMSQMRRMVGFDIEINANSSIAKAFDKLRIPYPRTAKTGAPSFTRPQLEKLNHPLVEMLLESRRLFKVRGTFLESYILEKQYNGRVYPQVNPLPSEEGGAVTGRPSVTAPNMNNLPSVGKDPINGKLVRGCMLPEEGEMWASCDYSQQEPRLMVHYAALARTEGADKAVREYNLNPNLDFHTMTAHLTGLPRDKAKAIFLGKCYGMGGAKYCRNVGLPTRMETRTDRNGKEFTIEVAGDEGEAQLAQFDRAVPWVKGLSWACQRKAKNKGYISTIGGRRGRFTSAENSNPALTQIRGDFHYKALNKLIQGSAADQTKQAMIDLANEGLLPLVTVYDELGVSVPNKQTANRVAEIMRDAIPLKVPVVVDVEVGPNWGACK